MQFMKKEALKKEEKIEKIEKSESQALENEKKPERTPADLPKKHMQEIENDMYENMR